LTTLDVFFDTLKEYVTSIKATSRQSPLSIAVAVERVKRLISRREAQIELEDFIRAENNTRL